MTYILALETTTRVCSVALHGDGRLVSHREVSKEDYSHAELLHVFISETLQEAGIQPSLLSAVSVAGGPGSYTGLRIGVSTAKGLCFAAKIPLISVDPLFCLAQFFTQNLSLSASDLILPMTDARRMEVFCSIYGNQLQEVRKMEPRVIDERFPTAFPGKNLHFIGDGASKFASVFQNQPEVKIHSLHLSAKQQGAEAFRKFQEKRFEDMAYYVPVYGKEFGG